MWQDPLFYAVQRGRPDCACDCGMRLRVKSCVDETVDEAQEEDIVVHLFCKFRV